jgi:hypothetical protein
LFQNDVDERGKTRRAKPFGRRTELGEQARQVCISRG